MKSLRDQWLEQKLGKFGASSISDLMAGGRRDMTPDELKAEKEAGGKRKTIDLLFGDTAMKLINSVIAEIITGQQAEDVTGLKQTQWGEDYENDALKTYAQVTGKDIEIYGSTNPRFFLYNRFSGASPDAVGRGFTVECKCPFNSANHISTLAASKAIKDNGNAWLQEYWPKYYAQTQFTMMACSAERVDFRVEKTDFISYDPRTLKYSHRLAIIPIVADADFQADLKHRLTEAAKIISSTLELLDKPSVLIATPITNGILVEKA